MNDREGAMSERELEEIEEQAKDLEVENSTYGQVHDIGQEVHTICLKAQRLVGEVHRSHAEAAELKDDKLLLAGQLKYQRERNVELRERVGRLEGALGECQKTFELIYQVGVQPKSDGILATMQANRIALSQANAQAKQESRQEGEGDGKAN